MFSSRVIRPASAALRRPGTTASAVRSYATPAATDTKPPVALYGLDGTYASALYTAAAKSSALEPTARSLETLYGVLKRESKLPTILNAPTLSVSDKAQIVAELEKHTGGTDKSGIVKNLMSALAENNRLGILEGVCEKFGTLISAYRGEMELIVTSAGRLDPKLLQRIETAVSKSEYSQGKKLKVVTKINPDVLGGLIVEVGDRTIDFSVASKISRMNKALTDNI